MNIHNNPYYQQAAGAPAYSRPTFNMMQPYPQMQQMYQQGMPQPAVQDCNVQVRFVASREEAVAASVIPGMPCLFLNRAQNEIYYKAIDPQTGMPDFRDYGEKQPEQLQMPQYATLDALGAAMQELEQRFEMKLAGLTAPRTTSRKAVNGNDE